MSSDCLLIVYMNSTSVECLCLFSMTLLRGGELELAP